MSNAVDINKKAWEPLELAQANDQVVNMAIFHGEYHWHSHEQDELFYVHEGEIIIQIKDGDEIVVPAGNLAVVPAGVEHCPTSDEPSVVLMFEPKNLCCGD